MTDQIALSLTCSRLRVAPVVGFNHRVPWAWACVCLNHHLDVVSVSRWWVATSAESRSRNVARRTKHTPPLPNHGPLAQLSPCLERARVLLPPSPWPILHSCYSRVQSRRTKHFGPACTCMHCLVGAQRWGSCSDPPPKLGARVPCWSWSRCRLKGLEQG